MRWLVPPLAALCASACVTDAPDVEVQPLIDTRDTKGPYQVRARVTDDGEVAEVTLRHGVLAGDTVETQPIKMTPEAGLNGVWRADIPGKPANTTILYAVEAKDDQGNVGCGPEKVCPRSCTTLPCATETDVLLSALRFRILPR